MIDLLIQNASAQTGLGPIPIPQYGPGGIPQLTQSIISTLIIILGAVSLIVMIVGGFQYIASAGNPDAAQKGKNTILGGIIGLAIALAAYVVVFQILERITP